MFGLFGTAWALMQFFFSPMLGALSDRFGRRPVVLLSNFGLALDYVLMALAPSLLWLFVGRVISGITSASVSTAFAYIADITPPEKRAAVFGKIGAAFGAGFVLGPALGGLLGDIDPRLPFWVAAGLSFANALYGLLILPESLPRRAARAVPLEERQSGRRAASAAVGSVAGGTVVANFIAQTRACGAAVDVRALCDLSLRLGHQDRRADAGAWSASARWWCRARAIGPIVRRFGERRALMLGLVCGAIGFLIFGARAHRAAVLDRHSRDGAVGRCRRGGAGA